jgi:hypothetical protein
MICHLIAPASTMGPLDDSVQGKLLDGVLQGFNIRTEARPAPTR